MNKLTYSRGLEVKALLLIFFLTALAVYSGKGQEIHGLVITPTASGVNVALHYNLDAGHEYELHGQPITGGPWSRLKKQHRLNTPDPDAVIDADVDGVGGWYRVEKVYKKNNNKSNGGKTMTLQEAIDLGKKRLKKRQDPMWRVAIKKNFVHMVPVEEGHTLDVCCVCRVHLSAPAEGEYLFQAVHSHIKEEAS